MDAQTTPTTPALDVDDLTALAVAVGVLDEHPITEVHYDYASGALVRVPAAARRRSSSQAGLAALKHRIVR